MLRNTDAPDVPVRGVRHDGQFLPLLRKSIAAHGIFLFISGAYMLILIGLFSMFPGMSSRSALRVLTSIALSSLPMNLLALVTYLFIKMAVYERPTQPTLQLCRNLILVLGNRRVWAIGLPMYLSLYVFINVFGLIKANITVFQPFAWDETFDRLDTVLHFGLRPWEWLQPVLGYPPVTFLVNLNYQVWFLVMTGFWVYYGFLCRPGEERTRYFLAFLLVWMIGGSLFAVLLSSAGPCFYGAGGLGLSPDPYAGLMAYLTAADEVIPVWALDVQELLWLHREHSSAFGGVSAMPSMHNATALLFLLTSRSWPLWVRRLLLLHFVLVYLGSIHLAWHYAVDAYLAWAITLAVWFVAGHLSRWWEGRPAPQAFRRAFEGR